MADTKHHTPSQMPVEADGVSYSGIVGFIVILTAVTIACQVLIYVLLGAFQHQAETSAESRSPLATEVQHQGKDGRTNLSMQDVRGGGGPQPVLLTSEPGVLEGFRTHEDEMLRTYGWVDKNAGVVRIPIDKAKDLAIERGFPVRSK